MGAPGWSYFVRPRASTRAKIEQSASRAMDLCSRGTGRYALVFDGEVPTGIFFVGVSGD